MFVLYLKSKSGLFGVKFMKKKRYVILIIFLLIIAIIYFIVYENYTTPEYIKKEIDLDISSCNILLDNDTHSGPLGDGEYIVKADCSDSSEDILSQITNWNEFPLSKNLRLIMYGGYKGAKYYAYELAEKNGIPKIENGYYLFIDRHDNAEDKYNDEDLFNSFSFNFTIAFYDLDTNYFYYFEFDT